MKYLILNADDFGLTPGVNEGIIRAHRDGILTSTTLMATGLAFDDAVARARLHPTLGVGCHLVLSGGRAVAPRAEIPSLADEQGRLPTSLSLFVARVTSGGIPAREIEIELRAQIEKIRRAGIDPTHVDTHKHTHVHPIVMNAIGRVARELGITRVRNPVENLRDSWTSTAAGAHDRMQALAAAAVVRAVASGFPSLSAKYGLHTPGRFLGLALTGQLGPGALARVIALVPGGQGGSDGAGSSTNDGVAASGGANDASSRDVSVSRHAAEIMLHPGLCDADLARTGSRLQQHRQNELDGLTSPEAKAAVAAHGIRLISYRDLN
jgi:chitin disaccharide deacetylase